MDKLSALFGSLFRATNPTINPEAAGGFAAGTLVHTQEGLKPIEQIQIGDYVLSKPENGGELAYKKVLKTFKHAPEWVIEIGYCVKNDYSRVYPIVASLHHPFWVANEGRTAADRLRHRLEPIHLVLVNDQLARVALVKDIFVSEQPNVGWTPSSGIGGDLWDYANHRLVANGVPILDEIDWGEHPDPYFKLPVYNLEVEDFHTYFVGEHGVWVR